MSDGDDLFGSQARAEARDRTIEAIAAAQARVDQAEARRRLALERAKVLVEGEVANRRTAARAATAEALRAEIELEQLLRGGAA